MFYSQYSNTPNVKKGLLLLLFSALCALSGHSQNNSDSLSLEMDSVSIVRNIIGFTPSKADKINGWAIGYDVLDQHKEDSLKINGLYMNLSPAQPIFLFIAIPYLVFATFDKDNYSSTDSLNSRNYYFPYNESSINGVSISLMEEAQRYTISGIQISGVLQVSYQINGASISGLVNETDKLNGIAISGMLNRAVEVRGAQIGLFNKARDLKGLQIGLFNKAKNLRGLQLGLWNKNSKFGFPIINFRFWHRKNE